MESVLQKQVLVGTDIGGEARVTQFAVERLYQKKPIINHEIRFDDISYGDDAGFVIEAVPGEDRSYIVPNSHGRKTVESIIRDRHIVVKGTFVRQNLSLEDERAEWDAFLQRHYIGKKGVLRLTKNYSRIYPDRYINVEVANIFEEERNGSRVRKYSIDFLVTDVFYYDGQTTARTYTAYDSVSDVFTYNGSATIAPVITITLQSILLPSVEALLKIRNITNNTEVSILYDGHSTVKINCEEEQVTDPSETYDYNSWLRSSWLKLEGGVNNLEMEFVGYISVLIQAQNRYLTP